MHIAIDVDDVLSEFSEAFIKYINKIKGINVKIGDLRVEDWWRAWGETQEKAVEVIYEFLRSPEAKEIRTKPFVLRALKILKQEGYTLSVITGRPYEVHDLTRKWVHDNLPEVFEDIYCTDFHLVSKSKSTKGSICEKIGADVLIDDYPGYAEECIKKGIKVLLFDSFWNHGFKLLPGMTRVYNWDDVLEEINKLNKLNINI